MNLASSVIEKTQPNFDFKALLEKDQDSINLTLKTYDTSKGLATRIHKADAASQKLVPSDQVMFESN